MRQERSTRDLHIPENRSPPDRSTTNDTSNPGHRVTRLKLLKTSIHSLPEYYETMYK